MITDNTNFSGFELSSSRLWHFTCGLAMAESERYFLPVLITKLEEYLAPGFET